MSPAGVSGERHAPAVEVRLDGPVDLAGFRLAARRLVSSRVAPENVHWQVCAPGEIAEPKAPADAHAAAPALSVPAKFGALCDHVLMHRDPGRFDLLYRLLWRLIAQPSLRHDPLDADMMQADRMARAVRRDMHKMRAFVRFTDLGPDGHVAWFEPDHHIVRANSVFFMRRFAQMHWAILTPDLSVEWDGQHLSFGPGGSAKDRPPADAGEHLWLAYYRSTFNPARPKVAMMVREMPRRYWPNLPEAALIAPLSASAEARTLAMVERPSPPPRQVPLIDIQRTVLSQGAVPTSLAELQAATNACERCPIGAQATQAVCGEGPVGAMHMLVGEQPGDREDLAGRPFVGPAGTWLDEAMAQLGWAREAVYLANAVKHFKFELRGKRRIHKTAGQREALACSEWLRHEIALVRPTWLVALGATAARALLGRDVAVQAERGRWHHERGDGRAVFVTVHPASLLRLPAQDQPQARAQWLADLASAKRGPPPNARSLAD